MRELHPFAKEDATAATMAGMLPSLSKNERMNNMEVTFTIKMNAQEVQRAIESGILAQLAQGAIAQEELDTVRREETKDAVVEDKPVGETPTAEAKSATTPAPAPVPKAAAKAETRAEPEALQEATKTNTSLEALRAKFVEVARKGKRNELKELLTEFGADSVSGLPETAFDDVYARLEAM